ncbi:MAG: hypothetical protein IIA89_08340 [Chloroflexi bacterium]|nr:hypothetical protein [Chloroflexota bacterium]
MGERYHRSQILLEPEQHERMRHIAKRESRSISDVAREVISIGLKVLANDEKARARRRSLALEHLGQIREAVLERHEVYEGDLVAEARSEREQSLERARRADE